jgi:hypothetical protein
MKRSSFIDASKASCELNQSNSPADTRLAAVYAAGLPSAIPPVQALA